MIEVLTELSEASTLEEDSERLLELVFMVVSTASTLDDDDERLRDDV